MAGPARSWPAARRWRRRPGESHRAGSPLQGPRFPGASDGSGQGFVADDDDEPRKPRKPLGPSDFAKGSLNPAILRDSLQNPLPVAAGGTGGGTPLVVVVGGVTPPKVNIRTRGAVPWLEVWVHRRQSGIRRPQAGDHGGGHRRRLRRKSRRGYAAALSAGEAKARSYGSSPPAGAASDGLEMEKAGPPLHAHRRRGLARFALCRDLGI